MIDIQKQEALREFVDEEIYTCQSSLVEEALKNDFFSLDDVENLYSIDYPGGIQDIFEWWVVSEWLVIKLCKLGEPVLRNNFGTWWGRTCRGQAIFLDGVIEKIYNEVTSF